MSIPLLTVEGMLSEDGLTLRLEKKVPVPPGRVIVTVQPKGAAAGPTSLEVLDRIHTERQRRGRRPMTEEEMAAEIAQMRADDQEYEERWRQIDSQTATPTTKTESS